MEKKEAYNTNAANKPVGSVCERLFNALNTNNTFRPLRRLTNWQQNPEPKSETQSNYSPATAATDAKHRIPSPPPPEKPEVAFTTPFAKNDVKSNDQKDASAFTNKKDAKGTQLNAKPVPGPPKGVTMPPRGNDQKDVPASTNKKDAKGAQPNTIPVPMPPKEVTWPQPAPPKGSTMPLPAQPIGAASTDHPDTKPKKSLNEKVEDYIHRTKGKLRSTTIARTQTTK